MDSSILLYPIAKCTTNIMPPIKVFLFGIDNAGKTALSMAIKEEQVTDTKPTIAFDISKWVFKSLEFAIWDAPGQIKFRDAWEKGFNKAQVLLYVIDTSDAARFAESKRELDKILESYETARVPLIILFHKMDKPESVAHIVDAREAFKVPLIRNRKVYCFQTSIKNPETLAPVRDALSAIIQEARWSS